MRAHHLGLTLGFDSAPSEGSTLGLTDNDDLGGDDGDSDYSAVVAPLLVMSSCVCVRVCVVVSCVVWCCSCCVFVCVTCFSSYRPPLALTLTSTRT